MSVRGDLIGYLPNGEEREFHGECAEEVFSIIEQLASDDWPDAMVLQGQKEGSGWIHVFHVLRLGWLVVCCGQSDAIEYFLTSGDSIELVEVRKAEQSEEYRRNQFVARKLAFQAISEFLRIGGRDKSLHWSPIGS